MTDSPGKLEVLANAELFTRVDERTLGQIAGISGFRRYEEGDTVYQMGDQADHAFVLVSGRVRFTLGVGNRPDKGAIMTRHMTFGWAALVDEHPRRVATASCLEPAVLLAIDGRKLLSILENDTTSGFLIMRRLASMIARNFLE